MNKKQKAGLLLIGLLIAIAAAGAVISMENQSYEDKIVILYTMLTADDSGKDSLSLTIELLKGNNKEVPEGAKDILENYGYMQGYQNMYRKELILGRILTIAAAAAIWGAYAGAVLLSSHMCNRKRQEELEDICKVITHIREGQDPAEMPVFISGSEISENAEGRVWMDLKSLAAYTAMNREQAAAEKEEMKALVTDISHQLKTPIAAFITSFEILSREGLTNEERIEFQERCGMQMIRLQELVAALVNISRMEKGMIEIRRKECRIFETIVLAINRVYQNAQEKQIEIALEAEDAQKKLLIKHDPKWLAEAMINLLENAIKYSPDKTTIIVKMVRMNLFLRIEIVDEGIGIPKSEWNLIFRRFYRGQGDAVQKKPGSGVGLFLARRILEQHEGTLSVSTPGGNECGSMFLMQIPY